MRDAVILACQDGFDQQLSIFCTVHTLSSALLLIYLSNIKKFQKNHGNTKNRTQDRLARSKNANDCARLFV